MAFQPSVDSFSIRRLGFKCSWWHRRQANNTVTSEPSIFCKNQDYKRFFPCRVEHIRIYISGSRCAWWQKTTKRHTHIIIHTHDNYSNRMRADYYNIYYYNITIELLPHDFPQIGGKILLIIYIITYVYSVCSQSKSTSHSE